MRKALLPILLSISTAHASECSVRNVLNQNLNSLPTDQQIIEPIKGQGGFLNPFYKEPPTPPSNEITERPVERRARLLSAVTERPEAETNQIIQEVKDLLLQEIAGSNVAQSPAQQLMLKRIQDLQVTLQDCNDVEGRNSHAIYEVKLCKNARKMPKLALVSLVAHELAHSIDLCNLGGQRYQRPHSHTNLSIPTDIEDEGLRGFVTEVRESSNPFLLDSPMARTPENLRRFTQLIEENGFKKVDEGVPLSSNPLIHPFACLAREFKNYKKIPETREELCRGSHHTEAGAQIWAARITGNYIATTSPTNEEKLGLFANSMGSLNKAPSGKEIDMNAIYFSDPNIQRAFGCTPSPQQQCLNEFRPAEDRSLTASIREFSELPANPIQVRCD